MRSIFRLTMLIIVIEIGQFLNKLVNNTHKNYKILGVYFRYK